MSDLPNRDNRGVADLLGDLFGQTSNLVRNEVRLAKAEMGEKFAQIGGAATAIGIGAALLLGGFLVLLQALVIFLAEVLDLSPTVSALIVGLGCLLIGFLVLRGGAAKLAPSNLVPERTAEQLSRDAALVKEQTR